MADDNKILIQLGEMKGTLGELKGTLNSFVLSHGNLNKRVDEHDNRIIKVENKLAWVLGASAGISLIVGCFLRFFH